MQSRTENTLKGLVKHDQQSTFSIINLAEKVKSSRKISRFL